MQKRRQQTGKQTVVYRFQTHQNHIALRHLVCRIVGIYVIKMKTAVARINLQSACNNIVVVAMEQKVHILAGLSQLCAVIRPYRPAANN